MRHIIESNMHLISTGFPQWHQSFPEEGMGHIQSNSKLNSYIYTANCERTQANIFLTKYSETSNASSLPQEVADVLHKTGMNTISSTEIACSYEDDDKYLPVPQELFPLRKGKSPVLDERRHYR